MPTIDITKWSKPQNDTTEQKTPVEYIGIVVPAFSLHVMGRASLLSFLKNKTADDLLLATGICTNKEAVMEDLAFEGLKKNFEFGCEIHIIECDQLTSSIFGIAENETPNANEFKDYIQKVTNTYIASNSGYLRFVNANDQQNNMTSTESSNSNESDQAIINTNNIRPHQY